MKRILAIIALFSLVSLAMPASNVHATGAFDEVCDLQNTSGQTTDQTATPSSVCEEANQDKFKSADDTNPLTGSKGIMIRAARLLSYVTGVASIIMIIVGGIKYVTSNGDANSITGAKNTIMYALIGIAVTIAAQTIILFAVNRLKQ